MVEIQIVELHETSKKQVTLVGIPSGIPLAADVPGRGLIDIAIADGEFAGKPGETFLLHIGNADALKRILAVGLGPAEKVSAQVIRQAVSTAVAFCRKRKLVKLAVDLSSFSQQGDRLGAARAIFEGAMLADYEFSRYRTSEADPLLDLLVVKGGEEELPALNALASEVQGVMAGVYLARDLVNEPGNTKSPEYLAETARKIASEYGLACTVLEKGELEAGKFGGLLGVAQGSVREPRLIVLEHRGGAAGAKPVVLVGKGVVFDAGGISLKPAEKMDEMKMDMAGGACVLGTLLAAARTKLPVNLVGIVPAVENLPSGTAYRPGDILTSLAGKTIEVLNTDAEGRLILGDALTYAAKFDPEVVVDLATLTGACIIALGNHASAVIGNDQELIDALRASGETSGERLWQLPLWDDYKEQIKSTVADIKNTGGRAAGTITAAAFLAAFTENYRWAHLDIAGTAWEDAGKPGRPKGGTGVGVRLLIDYLRQKVK